MTVSQHTASLLTVSRAMLAALTCKGWRPDQHRAAAAFFSSVASPAGSALSAASAPSAPSSSAAYVPQWQYQPSSTRRPSRSEVLHTYRSLLRLVRRTAEGQQQLWAKQRSEHWQAASKQPQQAQQAASSSKSALQLFEYSDRWLQEVRQQYKAHRDETDERRIGILHSDAAEYAALLDASIRHSVGTNADSDRA